MVLGIISFLPCLPSKDKRSTNPKRSLEQLPVEMQLPRSGASQENVDGDKMVDIELDLGGNSNQFFLKKN